MGCANFEWAFTKLVRYHDAQLFTAHRERQALQNGTTKQRSRPRSSAGVHWVLNACPARCPVRTAHEREQLLSFSAHGSEGHRTNAGL